MSYPFEEVWKTGPWRKIEKPKARERFERSVKTETDWQLFNDALRHYSMFCMRNKAWYTPKWGSTFMSQWRRWIDGEDRAEAATVTNLPIFATARCTACLVDHDWTVSEPYADFAERELICPEARIQLRGTQ